MSIKLQIQANGLKEMRGFMRGFRDDIMRVNQRSAERVGLKMEGDAVKHITNQDLGWTPNKPEYMARKEKKGLSDKVLVSTSTYLQSITSVVEKGRIWVGVQRDVRDDKGQSVADIAAVLEFGSMKRGIPARPLWSVVLRDTADWLRRENYFVKEIVKELKRKYGNTPLAAAADATADVIAPTVTLKTPPSLNTGSRGGRYHLSPTGRKIYHKRT